MTTLRFRSVDRSVSVSVIARLRQLTELSISDIRSRVAAGEALFEITPFEANWHERRHLLVEVAQDISCGLLPLTVAEKFGESEAVISMEVLNNLIKHFRQIETDTQRDIQLEMGEISDPNDFSPEDHDWTQRRDESSFLP